MSVQTTIFLNVLSAFIGSLLTVSARQLKSLYSYRKGRKFWRPFTASNSTFVIGRLGARLLLETAFEDFEYFVDEEKRQPLFDRLIEVIDKQENSGLIGVGDLEAIAYINQRLTHAKLPAVNSVERAEHMSIDKTLASIIVIGSGDMNDVAKHIMREAGCQLEVIAVNNHNVVVDRSNKNQVWAGEAPGPNTPPDASPVADDSWYPTGTDFGILVRTEREDVPGASALVLAGAQGLGTLAAAKACFDREEELLSYMRLYGPEIECLVKYEGWRSGDLSIRVNVSFVFGRRLVRPPAHH
jgi:hypothetical protein